MWVRTLVQGGQRADEVAGDLVAWLGEARKSLDLALYDLRLPGPVGDQVGDALRAARDRGVQVRIAFNDDEPDAEPRPFEPPPPRTEPTLLEQLGVPLAPRATKVQLRLPAAAVSGPERRLTVRLTVTATSGARKATLRRTLRVSSR